LGNFEGPETTQSGVLVRGRKAEDAPE
jgi:hypothetical protein